MEKKLKIEFLVSSTRIGFKEIPEFTIGLKIINEGHDLLPVDISKTTLYVNSERSLAWDLAVQNGTIVNLKIAPHQSEIIRWPMGEALFETSGTYELKLFWEAFSQKQKVVILND
jgi:hypothetical protein